MNIVLTAGTFDLLHEGHLNFIRACWEIAGSDGKVYVWVNEDDFVEKFKGVRPTHDQKTRLRIMRSIKGIFAADLLPDGNMKHALRKTKHSSSHNHFVVIGTDWAKRDYYAQIGMTREELEGLGYKLVYVEYTKGVSSTQLRAKMQKGS